MAIRCADFENEIPDFLEDRLDNQQLWEFLHHYDTCSSCREELSIQYLVYVGIKRWESGGSLDLNKELREYIASARKRLSFRRKLAVAAGLLEVTAVAAGACLAALMVYIAMRAGISL